MSAALPPEPMRGEVVSASMFPGSGFLAGDVIDVDAMNEWAVRYGWRCRFREMGFPGSGQVDLFYPGADA